MYPSGRREYSHDKTKKAESSGQINIVRYQVWGVLNKLWILDSKERSQCDITFSTVPLDCQLSIWKLQVSPKLKLFLWKLFQGALSVGACLAARNISSAIACKRCSLTESITQPYCYFKTRDRHEKDSSLSCLIQLENSKKSVPCLH